jgi:hypothetical protein
MTMDIYKVHVFTTALQSPPVTHIETLQWPKLNLYSSNPYSLMKPIGQWALDSNPVCVDTITMFSVDGWDGMGQVFAWNNQSCGFTIMADCETMWASD